ncbi:hypothetical protein ACFLW3_02085, partial [Chloroflexota bacterium]
MAKGKSKSDSQKKNGGWWQGFFRFLLLKPVRISLLAIILAVILLWQWTNIASWLDTTIGMRALELFDWGLIFIFVVILTLGWLLWRRKSASLIHHWNQWLGGIVLMLTTWGIIALFDLGGSFGFGLIGRTMATGILRITGLVIIAIVLIAPRTCLRIVSRFIDWMGKQLQSHPTPIPTTTT